MSTHILVAFLLIAFSCKSEVKSDVGVTDKTVVNQPIEISKKSEYDVKIVEQTEKEITKSADNKETPQAKATPKSETKSANTEVSPTKEIKKVEIESKQEIETSKPKEVIEVEPETKEDEQVIEEDIESEKQVKPERIETFIGIPKHTLFDDLLKAHVSTSGAVDYAGLKGKEATLDSYLTVLESNPPGTTWNRNQKLAYWINAYNAYTIKLILKNYPLASIKDLNAGKPWDEKWIKLDGKTLSLNNIENDIIRPKYNEPRIHFAVNCAAKSCPPILNGAYKAKSLDAQLESQTKKFINNTSYNTLGKNEISVSRIFDWYGEDFGDVASFVLRYADTTVKPSAKVTFMEYDWKLNSK